MATQNSALVRDNSTLANFKAWASVISAFFATAGWVQSSDTGQVNWSTIASVPTSGNYVYEIWKPGDGLQVFYLKIEYGTGSASSSTNPRIRLSIGTSTNGAGTLTGFVSSTQLVPPSDPNVTSTVTQYQCYFSGDSGRMAVMMWRDDPQSSGGNTAPIFFAIQRSLNSSGTPYGTSSTGYVTLISAGTPNAGPANQQSVVFGVGVAPFMANSATGNSQTWSVLPNGYLSSGLFNGQVPISPVFPCVGFYDNPMDIAAVGFANDFTEGATYVIASGNMPYGVSHTYLASKVGGFAKLAGDGSLSNGCLLMRYD